MFQHEHFIAVLFKRVITYLFLQYILKFLLVFFPPEKSIITAFKRLIFRIKRNPYHRNLLIIFYRRVVLKKIKTSDSFYVLVFL